MNDSLTTWDSNRWRHATQPPRPAGPQLSDSDAGPPAPASQNAILDTLSHHHSSIGKSRQTQTRVHDLPRLTAPSATKTDLSTYHSCLHGRHTPNCGPSPLANTSPRETSTGSWRSLQQDDQCESSSHVSDAPLLTLHIPHVKDPPRLSASSTSLPQDHTTSGAPRQHQLTPLTSLPSFSTFREHAHRSRDVNGLHNDPMSLSLSCPSCSQLAPVVREAAIATAELDEVFHAFCSKPLSRSLDPPNDSPYRTAQWVLDHLRFLKLDLQEYARRSHAGYFPAQHKSVNTPYSRNLSPPNSLKRPAETWERDDATKRPRSGASIDHFQLDRRASIDLLTTKDSRLGYSPAAAESVPGSAHPRQLSPTFAHRSAGRALPSPSSLAYPLNAPPSLPPLNASHPVGSPATSYQPGSIIHTSSSSSATSQHIADLQHQVTLKSLALQTLQSEYASLLQKLQRERVKSQTIEKKTNVVDQEVNDLTSKNEDLSEQVKILELQLEESEKKREGQRIEAAKEKDQWGRMLEMSGKLQTKLDGERQRLLEESTHLKQRIAKYEGEYSQREDQVKKSRRQSDPELPDRLNQDRQPHLTGAAAAASSGYRRTLATTQLEKEVKSLRARVAALRFTLEGIQRHNEDLETRTREVLQHTDRVWTSVSRALEDDDGQAADEDLRQLPPTSRARSRSRSTAPESSQSPEAPQATGTLRKAGTLEVPDSSGKIIANFAEVSRSRSPGFEEDIIHIMPSTSLSEGSIQAVGAVPIPLPSYNLKPQAPVWTPATPSSHDGRCCESVKASVHHVPSFGERGVEKTGAPGCSPGSYHSSLGDSAEDASSAPETFKSEPMLSPNHSRRPMSSDPDLAPSRLRTSSTSQHACHSHSRSAEWMPPPPKPEVTSYVAASAPA